MRRFLLSSALTAGLLAAGLGATANAATSVTAGTQIVNRPDSGAAGNWGLDGTTTAPMHRTLTITSGADCGASPGTGYMCYDATVTDSGGGITRANQLTPNQSGPYAGLTENSPGVDYQLLGHASYNFWANGAPAASNVPAYENDHYADPTGEHTTPDWYELAFPAGTLFAGTGIENNWSWSYATCGGTGEHWTDSAANGAGDLPGDGNIQGLACPAPKLEVSVPDVTGMKLGRALAALEAAGLGARVIVEGANPPGSTHEVVAQWHVGGTVVPSGQVENLHVKVVR
jgi:PASTA domain-containing protein